MKQKHRNPFVSDSALSLYSIFTLALAFALVCAAVLFVLARIGVFHLPTGGETETKPSVSSDFGEIDYSYSNFSEEELYARLLASYPFSDNFEMTVFAMYATSDGLTQTVCDMTKSGNAYSLTYGDGYTGEAKSIVCDGLTVCYYDAENTLLAVLPYTEALSFENVGFVPSFCLLERTDYTITGAEETEREYIVSYELPSLSYHEEVHIRKETGIVSSVRTYLENQLVCRFDVSSWKIDMESAAPSVSE